MVSGDLYRLRDALSALLVQALQSDLNNPSHEWGQEAIGKARAALRDAEHQDDWTVSDTDTAREILNYLGIGDDASKEPGADRRRDRVAQIIRKRIDASQPPLPQMILMSKADAIRKEYQLAHGRPCDCSTPDGALHYGRAQGLEIASDIVGASPHPDTLAEVTKERDHFYNQWRACWAPLTPRSENEKQGVERVLAILKAKLSDGGGIVGASDVQRAHNDFYRGRRVAFEECATMLRAALTTEGQDNG